MRLVPFVLALAVPASAQVATAVAVSMANSMAEEAALMAKEAQLRSMDWKKLEKIQNRLLSHMKKMNQAKKEMTEEIRKAKEEKAAIRRSRGSNPAQWPEEVRERDRHCDEVIANVGNAITQLSDAAKLAGQVNQSIGRMDRATFRQFAPQLHKRVLSIQERLKGIRSGKGGDKVFNAAHAQPLLLINQGKSVIFRVGGVEVKPGAQVRIPYTGTLRVHAMGWTPRRKLFEERTKKPVGSAVITSPDPYDFQYSVGSSRAASNTSRWFSEKENYLWKGPTLLLKTKSPFDPGKISISTGKRTGDTMEWTLPVVSQSRFGSGALGTQTFLFQVRGDVTWKVTRNGRVVNSSREDYEHFDGELLVKVVPQ